MNKLAYQIGVLAAKTAALGTSVDGWKARKPSRDSATALASLFKNHNADIRSTPDNKTRPEGDKNDKERSFWGPEGSPQAGDALSRQSDMGYSAQMLPGYSGV